MNHSNNFILLSSVWLYYHDYNHLQIGSPVNIVNETTVHVQMQQMLCVPYARCKHIHARTWMGLPLLTDKEKPLTIPTYLVMIKHFKWILIITKKQILICFTFLGVWGVLSLWTSSKLALLFLASIWLLK